MNCNLSYRSKLKLNYRMFEAFTVTGLSAVLDFPRFETSVSTNIWYFYATLFIVQTNANIAVASIAFSRGWRGNEVDQNRVKCFTVFRVEEVGHRVLPGLDLTHLCEERIYDRECISFLRYLFLEYSRVPSENRITVVFQFYRMLFYVTCFVD